MGAGCQVLSTPTAPSFHFPHGYGCWTQLTWTVRELGKLRLQVASGQMVNTECWEGSASSQVQDGLHSPCLCVGRSGAGLADGHPLVQNNSCSYRFVTPNCRAGR